MRTALIVIGVLALVLGSCARIPTSLQASEALLALRGYGSWAWAVGIALVWADVLLPIPQTAVIAALGIIYGTWLGPLGTAQLFRTPSSSSRKSQWSREASCFWTTKLSPLPLSLRPLGSLVFEKSRFRL